MNTMATDLEKTYNISTDDVASNSQPGTPPAKELKLARDGKTILDPQPSDSPQDPLNWSSLKKNAVFLSLLPGCFLTDWVRF